MPDNQIKIDPEGVRAFSASLQGYVDKDIAPTTDFVRHQLQSYGMFGVRSASPAVQDAALKYWNTIDQAIAFLSSLSHNTDTLARAAAETATAYVDADTGSVNLLSTVVGSASTEATMDEQAATRTDQLRTRKELLEERRDVRGGAA